MAHERGLVRQIIKNFLRSLTPRNFWGELRGKDSLGTEYYEAPDIRRGSRPSRWFVPASGDHRVDKPPEWEAWLSHRRKAAPTEEEIQINLQNRLAVVQKAKELEKPKTKTSKEEFKSVEKPAFPVYEDYQIDPTTNKSQDKQ